MLNAACAGCCGIGRICVGIGGGLPCGAKCHAKAEYPGRGLRMIILGSDETMKTAKTEPATTAVFKTKANPTRIALSPMLSKKS